MELKISDVFPGVDNWSRLCWVGILFFGCCDRLWDLGKCGGCGFHGREHFYALVGA